MESGGRESDERGIIYEMATGEIPSYDADAMYSPQVLAGARLYLGLYKDPQGTLQGMIDATLSERPLQEVFPDTPLSEPTEHFLQAVTCTEIELARVVLSQKTLFGDLSAFTTSLTAPLSPDQRAQFVQAIDYITAVSGEVRAGMILRRLNGEPRQCLAADYRLAVSALENCLGRARSKLYKRLDDSQTILGALNPTFPSARRSVVPDLPLHIGSVNESITELGRRMSAADLAHMAQLVVAGDCDTADLQVLLNYVNMPTHSQTPHKGDPEIQRRYKIMYRYQDPQDRAFFKDFRIRPAPRVASPSLPAYEVSDEATSLLLEALALPEQAPLNKQEQKDAAKDIEIGVYAERVAEEMVAGRSLESLSVTEKEKLQLLQQCIDDGKTAVQTLLSTHRQFVHFKTTKLLETEHGLLPEELMLAGMRGLLRAVRKYDYQHPSDTRFTTYASDWIRQSMWRCIFKESWGVSAHKGTDIVRVLSSRSRLTGETNEEVRAAHIAADLNMTVAEVNELLSLYQTIKDGGAAVHGDIGPTAVERQRFVTGFTFEPVARAALETTLADQPQALEILELHIAAKTPLNEIAHDLSLSLHDVQATLQKALATLAVCFSRDELRDLLHSERSSISYVPLSAL